MRLAGTAAYVNIFHDNFLNDYYIPDPGVISAIGFCCVNAFLLWANDEGTHQVFDHVLRGDE